MYSKDTIEIYFKYGYLKDQEHRMNLDPSLGLCRYCLKTVKYLKNGKHLRKHEGRVKRKSKINTCTGSHSLDYKHLELMKISESFEFIK